jgi:F-type H+-transporting ATPase subunit epsilon
MAETLTLEIVTPTGVASRRGKSVGGKVTDVTAPSVSGEFGVLPGHLPLLAALKPGILSWREGGQTLRAAVGGGFAEATATRVRLITEFFVKQGEVDLEAAQRDLQTAQQRLKDTKATVEDVEYKEAQRDYDWAQARILLAGASTN